MAGNELCGLDEYSHGTYTTEGITKLCEGLKGSAVTSLKCTTAPTSVHCYVSAPLTHAISHRFACLCSLGRNDLTNYGADMSGIIQLAEALKTNEGLTSL